MVKFYHLPPNNNRDSPYSNGCLILHTLRCWIIQLLYKVTLPQNSVLNISVVIHYLSQNAFASLPAKNEHLQLTGFTSMSVHSILILSSPLTRTNYVNRSCLQQTTWKQKQFSIVVKRRHFILRVLRIASNQRPSIFKLILTCVAKSKRYDLEAENPKYAGG